MSIIGKLILLYVLIGALFALLMYELYKKKVQRDMVEDIKKLAAEKNEETKKWSDFMVTMFLYLYFILLWPYVLFNMSKK